MVVDWKITTLGAEAELISGFPFRSNEYTEDPRDVRLLRGDNIVQGNIRWANAKRWSLDDAANFEQYELRKDDVVLAMDRPWIDAGLKYAAIDDEDLPCLLVQRTSRLRGGPNLDIGFLRCVIGSPEFTKHVQSITTGSLVPHISSRQIKDFAFKLPPISTQKRIAAVLSALDAKIALNQRINGELEGMAKLLYDYWFVQFDFPLSAAQAAAIGKPRLAGQPYRSSGGKMVFHPQLKREIPKVWQVKLLFEAMAVQYGFPFSTTQFTSDVTDVPVVRIRDILENTISLYTTEQVDKKYRLKPNDLVIGMDGNFHMNFWDKEGSYLNQRSVRVRAKDNSPISSFQSYFELAPYIKAREKNVSRTTVGHLSDKDLKGLQLLEPKISNEFDPRATFDSFLSKILHNRVENQELAALRDWLLPMLMNGQVRVGEGQD